MYLKSTGITYITNSMSQNKVILHEKILKQFSAVRMNQCLQNDL